MSRGLFSGLALAVSLLSAGLARAGDPPQAVDLARIRAILVDKCLDCHGADSKKGGLDLTRRESVQAGGDSGPAIEPGKPDESLLIERVSAGEMPPSKPLDEASVAALRAWIEQGAALGEEPLARRRAGADWWSLQPIRAQAVPLTRDNGWARNPIDGFILSRLEASGLSPAPEAERRDWIRRVTFDLTGLPPTPEEVSAFVGDDSPLAHERVVDRLLASPRYGERWARHWMDVVRFAESHGYETNQLRPNAWPYRDYLIRAFNRDEPYAQFVTEQLAGDTLSEGEADWLTRAATGFLVGGTHDVVGNQSPEMALQQRADDLDDIITATGTAFLGLTINCARCHDHKFDPITQRDYYGLAAVFAGIQHNDREVAAPDAADRAARALAVRVELDELDRARDTLEPLAHPGAPEPGRPPVNARRNVERFEPVAARFVRFTTRATSDGIEPCIDELEVWSAGAEPHNVALNARPAASSTFGGSDRHKLEHINDAQLGNARSWISAEPGRGYVELEMPHVELIDRIVWGRDRLEEYRDRLPVDYEIAVATERGSWQVVAGSSDRRPIGDEEAKKPAELDARRKELERELEALAPSIKMYAGTFQAAPEMHVLRRGDPMQPGDVANPSGVRALQPTLELAADTPEPERRRALAQWIANPANPLAARVMVNRLWHYHFGKGLVATPSDFGFNGAAPSHPELLDWLAGEFLANGGHLKPIHRLITLSATYRQSSRADARALEVDRNDHLLWRVEPRRLEAESLRDAMVATSGALDSRMGGPGYWIWEENSNYVVVFKPLGELGAEHFRRMVYQYRPRSQPDPTFGAFDCPDGGQVAPRRTVSTTALQALNLLHSNFVLDQAERFARRLEQEAGDDPARQIDRAFELAFGRDPTTAERDAGLALVRDHGTPALCRALFNASEFLYVP